MTSHSSTSLTFVPFPDKCLPSNTKSSQLFNSLQSLRPQPSYHCLPFSHAGGVPQEALCSEREEWFKRQSCSPQWHVGQSYYVCTEYRCTSSILQIFPSTLCSSHPLSLPPAFHPSCFFSLPSFYSSSSPLLW